jgi:hypothetical protein
MNAFRLLATGLCVSLLLGLNPPHCQAQYRSGSGFMPYSVVSFGGGTSTYFGDLAGYGRAPKALITLPRWNINLAYTRHFTPKLSARVSFTYARIVGDDYTFNKDDITKAAAQFARNLHFRNDLKEFSVVGIYSLQADGRDATKRAKLTPYIFLGVGLVAHSPEAQTPVTANADSSRRWVKLQPLNTEGQGQPGYSQPYSLIALAVPMGLGVRYKLNENFNLSAEIGFRYVSTDYLDDVGGNYPPDPNVLTGLARTMSDRRLEPFAARANEDRTALSQQIIDSGGGLNFSETVRTSISRIPVLKDSYLLTNFQLQYVIPYKIKCPPIR